MQYFEAYQVKDIKRRADSLANPILDHIIKCLMYPEVSTVEHWIQEIYSFIDTYQGKKLKSGGTFKMKYFFTNVYPVTLEDVSTRINKVYETESKLRPLSVNANYILKGLNYIIDTIIKDDTISFLELRRIILGGTNKVYPRHTPFI